VARLTELLQPGKPNPLQYGPLRMAASPSNAAADTRGKCMAALPRQQDLDARRSGGSGSIHPEIARLGVPKSPPTGAAITEHDNSVMEILRRLPFDMVDLKQDQRSIRDALVGVRQRLHAMQGDSLDQEQDIAGLLVPRDRIKTRLGLSSRHPEAMTGGASTDSRPRPGR